MVSKGTVTSTVRWEASIRDELLKDAQRKGYTLSAYIREIGLRFLQKTKGYTLQKVEVQSQPLGVDPTVEKTIPVEVDGEIINVPERLRVIGQPSNATLPVYNKDIHKAGEMVLVRQGKNLMPVRVPELDAEGNVIPEVK